MNYDDIKKHANSILANESAECSYIEYKRSSKQLDKILKTICAFGNNYYDNDMQYIFLGVDEVNNEESKSTPSLPIAGINEGALEKCKNDINSLRSYLYPNVSFEIIVNEFEGTYYLLIVVPRQSGGPFMVNEKAEKDKKINLKAGRYVRIESDSRIARVDEEYDLLRKFANFHFSSITNSEATIDDLSIDYLKEYIELTSNRSFMSKISKSQMAKSLRLLDRNDPLEKKVKNYAVLMFANKPDEFIPYAYTELIVDMYGTKRKMESKLFKGPIWKQYYTIVDYINNNFLNTIVIREDGVANNKKVTNYPFIAIEELVANAIVHNNYENGKPLQIYVSEKQINIVNYNKPLPPLRISDLNERTFFSERDTENPEIRDMFKSLGIIESFGTGIGEAKKALQSNGSPDLYYKTFDTTDNVTSVVIPVNEEYLLIKNGADSKSEVKIELQTKVIKEKIMNFNCSKNIKKNILKLYDTLGTEVFGNTRVSEILGCSETTATKYINRMSKEMCISAPVEGIGKSKYRFLV